jgi:hypothetical protein
VAAQGADRDGRIASASARSDPQGTGSIGTLPRRRGAPGSDPSGDPGLGAVQSVFEALEILGRRAN